MGSDGRFVVTGGEDEHGALHTCEAYCPTRNAWQPLPDMLLPRRGHTMCRVGADLIVLGGARGRGAKAKTVTQLELFDGAKWCAPSRPA